MSYSIITDKTCYQLVKQAQGYLSNVNVFRCALRERKPNGGFTQTSLYHREGICNVCSDLQIPKRDKSNEVEVCRNKLVGGTTLQVVFKG